MAERQAIERVLSGARVGRSGALAIVGDPGIGKTALLEFARAAASQMRRVGARGVEAEREVAFSGLHQICAPLLGGLDELPPPQAEALAVALALRAGSAPERFAVGAAVLGLLTRAADERPLAVFVDDAHLLDPSSGHALAFAARRLEADRVALVVSLRSEEESPLLDLPVLRLDGLGVEDTRALVTARGDEPWGEVQLQRYHEATGGNPLAIIEMASDAQRLTSAPSGSPLPLTGELLERYSRRIVALPDAARSVLLLAATDSHDLRVLSRACVAAGCSLQALAPAEASGLVTVTDDGVEFAHPLVRAAAYGAATPADRRAAHRHLAAATPELDRRAWHVAEGALGQDDAAADVLEQAAQRSAGRGANAVAAAQYQRCAALTGRPGDVSRRLSLAGGQFWLSGASGSAVVVLEEALDRSGTPLAAATARGRLGAIAARSGSLERARDLQLAAADEMAPQDRDAAILLFADAVDTCFFLCDTETALRTADRLAELTATGAGPAATRLGRLAAGVALTLGGSGDEGARNIRAAMALSARSAVEPDQWQLRWSLIGPLFLRESGPARHAMTAAVSAVRTRAAVGTLPFLLTLVARDDAGASSWADAESGYDEAIRLAREVDQGNDLALALAGLAWLEARTGHPEACRVHAAEAEALGSENSAHLARIWSRFAIGDLELAGGDLVAATSAYDRLAHVLTDLGVRDPDLWPGPELVECHQRRGDVERAAEVAHAYMGMALAKGQPWAMARAHRAMALTASPDRAESAFAEALALHDRTPDAFESARTVLAYGEWLRRARRRVDARPLLRAGLSGFEALGARPWADRAASEIEATGEPALRGPAGIMSGLTPQERQIVVLLADGRTTREAAVALFLSPKTVEYHLRHVYQKLDIHSREELAAAVGDPDRSGEALSAQD